MSTNTIKLGSNKGDLYINPQNTLEYKGITLFGYGYLDWGSVLNQSLVNLIDKIDLLQDSGLSELQFDLTEYEETQKRLRAEEFSIWKSGFGQSLNDLIQTYINETSSKIKTFTDAQTIINTEIAKEVKENFDLLDEEVKSITSTIDEKILDIVQTQIIAVNETINTLSTRVEKSHNEMTAATDNVNKVLLEAQQLIQSFKTEFSKTFEQFKDETNNALVANKEYLIEYIDSLINTTKSTTNNIESRLLSLELLSDALNPDTVRAIITSKVNEITAGIINTYLSSYEDRLDIMDNMVTNINNSLPTIITDKVNEAMNSIKAKINSYDASLLSINKNITDITNSIGPLEKMKLDIEKDFETVSNMTGNIITNDIDIAELQGVTGSISKDYKTISRNIINVLAAQDARNTERIVALINANILNLVDGLGNTSFDELSLIKRSGIKDNLFNNISSEIKSELAEYELNEFKFISFESDLESNKIIFAFKLPRPLVSLWKQLYMRITNTNTSEEIETTFKVTDSPYTLQQLTKIDTTDVPLEQINVFRYSIDWNASSVIFANFTNLEAGNNLRIRFFSDEDYSNLILESNVNIDNTGYLNMDSHYRNDIYPNMYKINETISKPTPIVQNISWSNTTTNILVPICQVQSTNTGAKEFAIKIKLPNGATLTNIVFNDGFTSQTKTFTNQATFPLTETEYTNRNLSTTTNYYKDICSTGLLKFGINQNAKKVSGTITYVISGATKTHAINTQNGGGNTEFVTTTITAGNYYEIDTNTIFGTSEANKMLVDVKVKDKVSTSETYNMFISGDNLVTIAVKDNRYIRVYNEYISDLEFYIALTER